MAGMFDKDSDYGGMLGEAILNMVRLFSMEGHSGASAGRTLALFKKVASYETLLPLTGKDDEWNDVSDDSFQNNRNSTVFKDKKTGKSYFLDGVTWRTQSGLTWNGPAYTGAGEKISSRQFIKSFPFVPKTFYIDVIEEEIEKDDWKFTIKDDKQLDEVRSYYDLPPSPKTT